MEIALDVKLRLQTLDHALDARTVNVSREGLYLVNVEPRHIGTRVRVRVEVYSPREDFDLTGVVLRSDESGTAVFIVSASDGWERFCDDLARRAEEGVTWKDRQPKLTERERG